tara:strand:- start:525 stop:2111 length:1587 start_codon:yes stop_codon:yes gene_type:complete
MTQKTGLKNYKDGRKLQTQIVSGINKLADNVASTLGPKGRNVLLYKKGESPVITKDGVTVAKFVDLSDPFEDAGAQIIKQAASQTNSLAGDGTTTSTVLARSLINSAQKYLATGACPTEMKRGMDKALIEVTKKLQEMAYPLSSIEDIENIATISANGDSSIGKMIATAIDQAGKDGSITVDEGRAMETSVDVVEGFRFDSGYYASAFITDERRHSIEYHDALVLVTDHKIDQVQDILPVLEVVARENMPFIIVAEELEGQALAALIMNTVRGTMRVAAVKAPRYGQERRNILSDLCLSVGATFVSRESGIKLTDVKLEHLGRCKRIEVLKNETTIVDGQCDWEEVENKIESLKEEIKQTEDLRECEAIQERISRLASGVAIIKVGAPTEIEMIEKKHRVEDALEAVKSAREEGIVPGGGTALIRCSDFKVKVDNEDQKLGVEIVRKALFAPVEQMAKNAGKSPDIICNSLKRKSNQNIGYDFGSEKFTDMIEAGVLDPVKVTRIALQNAVSVSSTLLTTNYAIAWGD